MIYNLKLQIDRKRAEKRFIQLMGESAKIEINKKNKRSVRQNSYLHLIIGFFALETGYTTTEAKQIYKQQNAPIYKYNKEDKWFIRSSADLSTTEMAITIDRFRDYSSDVAGIYLPEANEDKFLDEIESELSKNKYI